MKAVISNNSAALFLVKTKALHSFLNFTNLRHHFVFVASVVSYMQTLGAVCYTAHLFHCHFVVNGHKCMIVCFCTVHLKKKKAYSKSFVSTHW